MVKFKNKMVCITSIIVLILVLVLIYFITSNIRKDIKEYKNNYYSFKYDSTWKINKKGNITSLINKRSKGKITITYKELDTYLIDVDIKDIISDITYEVEKQNKGYNLVNRSINDNGSYEFLYEKDKEECLVYIYKQDNILLFVYYNTKSKYFDITLDSLETIINSIKVYSGEKM